MKLLKAARAVRKSAHVPYSKCKSGVAIRGAKGEPFTGCDVENVACPEESAIAASVRKVVVGKVKVTLANRWGAALAPPVAELLPGAFVAGRMHGDNI